MKKPISVGIIGLGGIGLVHVRAFRECSGAKVSAVCDIYPERAKAAAAEFDIPQVFSDYRELLAEDLVEAVVVATPNNMHMPVTLAALEAGAHVLCEKPLAMNGREARAMVAAAKKTDRVLMTAQVWRYRAEAQFIKKLAEAGRFGELYYAKAMWLRRAGIPRGWFQDAKQSGGGPLIDLGVHMFDLIWWMMGLPKPVSVMGVTFSQLGSRGEGMGGWGVNYAPGKFTVEDMASALIRFEDGRAVGLETSWAAHTEDIYFTRFFGTKAGAQLQPSLAIWERQGGVDVEIKPRLPETNAYKTQAEHFLTCLRRGQEPLSPASQSIVVMDLLDAIYKSARSGRLVSLE